MLSLSLSLFQHVGEFLSPHDVLQLSQVSQHYLTAVASHFSMEFYLENMTLNQEDFLTRFGKHGLYEEAQCINLSNSDFQPAWLKHLPKSLKSLKLKTINKEHFYAYGFESESAILIEIARALVEASPKLKFLNMSSNNLKNTGAAEIAKLTSLNSLNISDNFLGEAAAEHIRKFLP